MAHPTKQFFVTRDGKHGATIVTTRVGVKAALIGNFKGEGFRVISLHNREELARPEDVANSNFTDIQIAYPI